MKNFRPIHTLSFLIFVVAALAFIAFLFQSLKLDKGIQITGNFSLNFPRLSSFLPKKEKSNVDISKILALADSVNAGDSLPQKNKNSLHLENDSLKKKNHDVNADTAIHKLITSIQFKDGKKGALDKFFLSLELLHEEEKSVRVLHYGDSQIESDRITDYLRLKLQNEFGGEGPGFISACPLEQGIAIRQTCSDNFERYNIFIGKDKRTKHANYGVMAGFCRFIPPKIVSDSSKSVEAFVKVRTTMAGGPKVANYSKVKMYYGGAQRKTAVEFLEGGIVKEKDSLVVGGNFNIKSWSISTKPGQWEVKFSGKDSPDIYGFSLEGSKGVMVDNIALRGSSGTFFNQMNLSQLQSFYNDLNVKLIILEFGGNALPLINDSAHAVMFGRFLKLQIVSLKKIAPNSSFLVIGPADMSVKEGTEYLTHPQLENTRDAIRKAAFETGCAFWDMYEVMGGRNSMVTWVDQQIAATDYIHFSGAGARKISTLLYAALIKEYNNFLNHTTLK